MKVTSSIIFFLVFIIIIAIPPAALQYTGNTGLLTPNFWTVFCFMSGITFLIVAVMLIVGRKNQEHFTPAFLGGTTFKLLACLIFIFVFLSKNPSNKPIFLANFLYVYLLNTVFEVYV
ncbi:hypothetical protein, partial [uncultured Mucilaginibacter sp.]|uniref:hypothetical protein n=1 Tax=uncultured Mucilaginibacter sp. TaxID=797541 RepID=UPI0025EAB57A